MRVPIKNRKREMCSKVGNASIVQETCHLSTPSEKNARSRARLCGLYRDGCVILMYRRAHFCTNAANIAEVRLISMLKNQSEFTHMAELAGENVEALAAGKGGWQESFSWERD